MSGNKAVKEKDGVILLYHLVEIFIGAIIIIALHAVVYRFWFARNTGPILDQA